MRFGRWDFERFLRECPAAELAGWQAFAEQDPVGWLPEWGPFSELMSWLAAVRPFGGFEVPASAFLPRLVAAPVTTAEEAKAERVAKVKAGGGKVITPPPVIPYTPNGK